MAETSARLLRLLSLLQGRLEWTGPELAERLGVSTRTVRRDVDRLRGLGYPVHATAGAAGYRLGAGAALPPLLLDDDEAVAVALGLRVAAGGGIAGLDETALRAMAKLEQVLPARLRPRVDALRAATVTLDPGGTVQPATLALLALACRDRQRVRLDYTPREGRAGLRVVEPHRLVHAGRRWYLLAWDTGREDWRTLRVDRLAVREPIGPRFARRTPPEDAADFTARAVSVDVYRHRGRFTLHASAEAMAERLPPTIGVLEPVDATTCVLVTGSNSLEELAVWVGLLGVDFEVHEPPELVEVLRSVGERLVSAAASRGSPRPGPGRGGTGAGRGSGAAGAGSQGSP